MTVWYACWTLQKKKNVISHPRFFWNLYLLPRPTAECEKSLLPAFLHLNYDARAGIRINQGRREAGRAGGRRGRWRIARQQRYQPWEEAQEAIKGPRNHPLICGRWKTCSPPQINKQARQSGLLKRIRPKQIFISHFGRKCDEMLANCQPSENFIQHTVSPKGPAFVATTQSNRSWKLQRI